MPDWSIRCTMTIDRSLNCWEKLKVIYKVGDKDMNIIQTPSKNFYNGRFGHKPELIVIHCTDGFFPSDLQWLTVTSNPPVSSSYYVAPAGGIHQLVDDANGAWHAGRVLNPTAKLLKKNTAGVVINPNYYSIGIEVSLKPPAFVQPDQWKALKELIVHLATKHNIPIDRDHIIGHKEIYSAKTCPGTINVDRLVLELQTPPSTGLVDKEEFKNKIINYIKTL